MLGKLLLTDELCFWTQTNLSICRANLQNFSRLNNAPQPETLNSETQPFTRHLFQLKNKVQYYMMLVSNKSHVCTRSILRIQFSLLWKQKYHKPVMAENFAKKNFRELREPQKRPKKMRINFKTLIILETTFNIKRIQRLELYLAVL